MLCRHVEDSDHGGVQRQIPLKLPAHAEEKIG